jgi:hypothetical protein
MLRWSGIQYKLTLGLGGIAMLLLIRHLADIGVWYALVIGLLPFTVFLFADPADIKPKWSQLAQLFAALWYLVLAAVLFAIPLAKNDLPENWGLILALLLIGTLPCVIVLYRFARENRKSPSELEQGFDDPDAVNSLPSSSTSSDIECLRLDQHAGGSTFATLPPMECYVSPWKLIGLLGLTTIMVGASGFCTQLPAPIAQIAGWCGVAFFGLGFVVIPARLFRTSPQVIINEGGIEDRRSKMGVIRWVDIHFLTIGSVQSQKFLCIETADPEVYLCRLSKWKRRIMESNQFFGLPPFIIGFQGLSPGLNEVWKHLADHFAVHGESQPPNVHA